MQGNESFAAHLKKEQVLRPRATESSLITLERSQKLDLLIHLISNLTQSLVICGPNGIGKTTLLNELEVRKQDLWSMVTIHASNNLSLESIEDELFRFLKQKNVEFKNQGISSILSMLDKQNQKIVVIIDDAGTLTPGLITSLIHYAAVNSCLRMVFSLTHDELHLKNSSDSAIEGCHFIEIPPLTEKQCSFFLQLLSGQPGAIVPFNAINERMIEKLYRETHGIPGRIVEKLPKLSNYSAGNGYNWLSIVVIFALVIVGVSVFISAETDRKTVTVETKPALVLQKAEVVEISSPVIYPETKDKSQLESIKDIDIFSVSPVKKIEENDSVLIEDTEKRISEKNVRLQHELNEEFHVQSEGLEKGVVETIEKHNEKTIAKTTIPEKGMDSRVIEQKSIPIEEKKADKTEKAIKTGEANQWVLEQSKKNYTIQLMVLSNRDSVLIFLKKNKNLKENIKFYKISKQGQKKYVLIYGSFESLAIAINEMKLLPIKYRKSWVRQFETLQEDIKQ